jgi:hypothetical protein
MTSISSLKVRTAAILCGAALVGLSVAAAAPANAVYNCVTGFSSVGPYAKCGAPANSVYRVAILCQNYFTFVANPKYGNWVNTNSSTPSTIQGCAWFEHYYGSPWVNSQ